MEEIIQEYELNKIANNLLLNVLKMKNTCTGTCYLMNAITYYILKEINDHYKIKSINEVYTYIANKYNTSVDCVEKAMRYAKEKSRYLEYTDRKMNNWELLSFCVKKVKMFNQ